MVIKALVHPCSNLCEISYDTPIRRKYPYNSELGEASADFFDAFWRSNLSCVKKPFGEKTVATHQVQKEYLLLLNTMVKKNFDGLDTRTSSGLIIMVSCKLLLCKMYIILPSIGSRRRIYR